MKTMKLKWLFLASLLNNTGSALLWPLITVYVHDYLHESMTVAGIVMFFISMAMMAGNYCGGWLFDHWRPYQAAVLTVLVATVATSLLIFFHGWPTFVPLAMLSQLCRWLQSNDYQRLRDGSHFAVHPLRL